MLAEPGERDPAGGRTAREPWCLRKPGPSATMTWERRIEEMNVDTNGASRQRLRLSSGTELSFITAGEASKPAVLLPHGTPNSARMFWEVAPALG